MDQQFHFQAVAEHASGGCGIVTRWRPPVMLLNITMYFDISTKKTNDWSYVHSLGELNHSKSPLNPMNSH